MWLCACSKCLQRAEEVLDNLELEFQAVPSPSPLEEHILLTTELFFQLFFLIHCFKRDPLF